MGHDDHVLHDHDRGLRHDLPRLIGRRRALQVLGATGVALLAGCSSDDGGGETATSTSTSASTSAPTTTGGSTACTEIPEETAGPFPGDKTNGPDILTQNGVVRSDMTSSFGSSNTVAEGVPLTITLTVVDAAAGCQPLAGAAVYLWHCDRDGRYSMYSQGVEDENYLRGVQETAADGTVTFVSIFPGAYPGRWPHAHLEVYPSLDAATSAGDPVATSQLALPEDACNQAYSSTGYDQSASNLAQTPLASDMVFGDDQAVHQLAGVDGDADAGLTARLTVPV